MKKRSVTLLTFFAVSMLMTSCAAIGGIFKAGMGVGIFIVIAVIALIIFVISKMGGKK